MGVMIRFRGAAVCTLLSMTLLAVGCASVPKSAAVPWDALKDSQDLIGASQQTGDYTGKLVLLPCTLMRGETGKMQCDQSGHRPGLMVDGDPVVHPLIAGDAAIRQKLQSPPLQGKRVRVTGILYPDIKAIFVGDITLQR